MDLERQYRLTEAATLTGYTVAGLRKKIRRRELGYRKTGRIITIPASDIAQLLGERHAPVALEERSQ
jgi:hypothetical protein